MSSVEVSGDHLPYKYKDAPPPNWDTIRPMTGSHIPGVDTGARGGMTTFMTGGGPRTIGSGMGSFGGGMRGLGGSGLAGDGGGSGELQRTVNQFDASLASQTDNFIQNLSDQTAQVAVAGIDAQSQTLLDQTYAGTVDPYYHAGSVGDLTQGVAYDSNGFGVEAGQAGGPGGSGGRAAIDTAGLAPGFTTPRDAQIEDNTHWVDYAHGWLNYASSVPSAGRSLDYATINAAIGAYNAAAATDPGTPEFNAKWQTATDAINTMVTVNDWHYAPAAPSGPAVTPTLATVNVAPTPDELAQAGIASGNPNAGRAYGPLDDLRGLGNAVASGVADVDRGIARFNGAVNDELVDQGAEDLRNGNKLGYYWNAARYTFYNTFMPNSVEGAAAGLVGGAAIGKGVGLAAKGATELWPVLARRIGNIAGDAGGLDSQAIRNATQAQISGGYKPDTWTMTTLQKGDVVYGGLPGQSAFYTDRQTLMSANFNQRNVFNSIQSRPHSKFGYRPGMGIYEVTSNFDAPTGRALVNMEYGSGGGRQFYIQNYKQQLRLIGRIQLEK